MKVNGSAQSSTNLTVSIPELEPASKAFMVEVRPSWCDKSRVACCRRDEQCEFPCGTDRRVENVSIPLHIQPVMMVVGGSGEQFHKVDIQSVVMVVGGGSGEQFHKLVIFPAIN